MPAIALHQRKRGTKGSGNAESPLPKGNNNGLLSWGFDYEGALGGGYEHFGEGFNFPQGVIVMTKVVQIACGERSTVYLDDSGRVWNVGSARAGAAGQGTAIQEAGEESSPIPLVVAGGVQLWPAETYTDKKGTFILPRGPIGPVMPPIAAIGSSNGTHYALTQDGRVLAWGSNSIGQIGNAWTPEKSEDPKAKLESGKWRPQAAPWWVQIGGPAQSETGKHPGGMNLVSGVVGQSSQTYVYDHDIDPTWGSGNAANILKNVKCMAFAHLVSFFAKTNGEVFYCGSPERGGSEPAFFATPDTVWNEYAAAHGITNITAICAGHGCYGVLLGDGTVRVVGIGKEGMYGDGTAEQTLKREVHQPFISPSVPLANIVAISQGEYHFKALDSSGRLWTWGSNGNLQESSGVFFEEGQQGLGFREAPVLQPVQITSLGTNVAAVAAGGMERGTGTFGGDTCIVLMKDTTVRTFGKNFNTDAPGGAVHGQGVGALGDATFVTSSSPVTPQINGAPISGVTLIEAGQAHMVLAQEPGAPPTPTVSAQSPEKGKLVVEWQRPPGTVGVVPIWRAPEGWDLKVQRQGVGSGGKPEKAYNATNLAAATSSHIFSVSKEAGQPSDIFEVIVTENDAKGNAIAAVSIPPTGGSLKTGNGHGEIPVAWGDPPKSEPGWYVEWQRTQQFRTEKQTALTIAAAAGALTINVVSTQGLAAGVWIWIDSEVAVIKSVAGKESGATVTLNAPLAGAHAKGAPVFRGEEENFHRSTLLAGATRAYTIVLTPSPHGATSEQCNVIVESSFIGSFRKRICFATVIP